jgi:hypothetical protein
LGWAADVEPLQERTEPDGHSRRRQFDGQRKSVEPADEGDEVREILGRDLERRERVLGTFGEQLNRLVRNQRCPSP